MGKILTVRVNDKKISYVEWFIDQSIFNLLIKTGLRMIGLNIKLSFKITNVSN